MREINFDFFFIINLGIMMIIECRTHGIEDYKGNFLFISFETSLSSLNFNLCTNWAHKSRIW